ncbi:hypothetical protein AB4516_22080 [Vibrio sp. 10N.222.54.F12]|uniref:Methyltransferase n=1 Tax=Vibrio tasmaniensis 1F-267 TaxID=1191324 RepID=A0ABX3BBM3_9VIBR|nr:hypothetical protein [Vibrio tasmaniensis]OEF52935.1 hypothetical protein A163_18285 [Vibrio tasmaniensis 1F-267]OEF77422.1 hypothetical protein A162_16845 [Vibrio tasmaniensis 1F-155]PML18956.1 hypothetical protein BCT83_22175 [Vibrio tasmaniensis]PML46004.1 hypothetical protein BCT76_15950 [Vibrio tasmaniensis]PMO77695.1 hypothetical protein BCT01_14060 [Vibrio tasmaniensis]
MSHFMPPDPHPLDYDWRFTRETVDKLSQLFDDHESVLSLGVPSLIRKHQELDNRVFLVDRQPLHWSNFHSLVDVDVDLPLCKSFDAAVIDPPWYIENTIRWISWSAQHLAIGSKIYISLWPELTRPQAIEERKNLFEWLTSWADFEIKSNFFCYETPVFEMRASEVSDDNVLEDWRFGDLLVIKIKEIPPLSKAITKTELWHRFVIDDYQLALRVNHHDVLPAKIIMHPLANGWYWPSVSRRAIGREVIDLWSSQNKVGTVIGSANALEILRFHLGLSDKVPSSAADSFLTVLQQWNIPNKPYKRVMEWQHLA